ncbi:10059_t:CDS:2, partial [Cetraspora pellucida]
MLDKGLLKVRDHDHISDKYRGPAYSDCNKKLQISEFKMKIPLICYNFQGYDSHLLIEVVSRFTANRLKCILANIGKYKAMDVAQAANISKGDYEHAQKDDRLDPSHYVLAPEMFNNSLYKSSEVEIKLMTDMDKYLMVKNGIHRGMTMILEKIGPEEIPDIQSIESDAKIGYMLEVDIEAPINMHNFFADYLLALKKQIISENWLSLYNERLVYDEAVG